MSSAASSNKPAGEKVKTIQQCDNSMPPSDKQIRMDEILLEFYGEINSKVSSYIGGIVVGDPELEPVVVPVIDPAEAAVVRAEQIKIQGQQQAKLDTRREKKREACALISARSDTKFSVWMRAKPDRKQKSVDADLEGFTKCWKEWFLNKPLNTINTPEEIEPAERTEYLDQHFPQDAVLDTAPMERVHGSRSVSARSRSEDISNSSATKSSGRGCDIG